VGAAALPGVPGVAGLTVAAARAADKAHDLANVADAAGDAAKVGKEAAEKAAGKTGTAKPRRRNELPDTGEPNTVVRNAPGTQVRRYGPDGKPQKDWNKGHDPSGGRTPKKEQEDHIHDWKPNPRNPKGTPTKQPGRSPPRPRDLVDLEMIKK
jgi:hypothetical protein